MLAVAGAACLVGVGALSLSPLHPVVKPLMAVLTLFSVAAELTATRYSDRLAVSGAFVGATLAMGFLGGSAAFVLLVLTVAVSWAIERYRWQAVLINVAGSAPVALLGGELMSSVGLNRSSLGFVLVLAAVSAGFMTLNLLITPTMFALLDGGSVRATLREAIATFPAVLLNIALASSAAGIYAGLGPTALAFVLFTVIGFTYMSRLVITARQRTKEYANLSWGVLSGLIRTLDERDARAARHCAAVAAFSRDIAKQAGMSKRDQELAHT
ncbi:MAG: hypothetical protein QOG35_3210 [Solirubrobacteraceae bacterium]|nr:hypothetical protein [Solirubrobacteraceae bacterium]